MSANGVVFERDVAVTTSALAPARDDLQRWLEHAGVSADAGAELLVVFSELVSNAIAASEDGTHVHVCARLDTSNVVLEVHNGGPRTVHASVAQWDLTDNLRGGGRGLLLVKAFVDAIEVEPPTNDRGIVVRCRRRL